MDSHFFLCQRFVGQLLVIINPRIMPNFAPQSREIKNCHASFLVHRVESKHGGVRLILFYLTKQTKNGD